MRKPKDFDSELKALDDRARQLKTRKLQQLGELVVATGADTLPVDVLAGALLSAAGEKRAEVQESWRERGAAFFCGAKRKPDSAEPNSSSAPESGDGTLPFAGVAGAQ